MWDQHGVKLSGKVLLVNRTTLACQAAPVPSWLPPTWQEPEQLRPYLEEGQVPYHAILLTLAAKHAEQLFNGWRRARAFT